MSGIICSVDEWYGDVFESVWYDFDKNRWIVGFVSWTKSHLPVKFRYERQLLCKVAGRLVKAGIVRQGCLVSNRFEETTQLGLGWATINWSAQKVSMTKSVSPTVATRPQVLWLLLQRCIVSCSLPGITMIEFNSFDPLIHPCEEFE